MALSLLTGSHASEGRYNVKTRLSRGTPLEAFVEKDLSVEEGELTTFDSGTNGNGQSVIIVLTASAHSGAVKRPQ